MISKSDYFFIKFDHKVIDYFRVQRSKMTVLKWNIPILDPVRISRSPSAELNVYFRTSEWKFLRRYIELFNVSDPFVPLTSFYSEAVCFYSILRPLVAHPLYKRIRLFKIELNVSRLWNWKISMEMPNVLMRTKRFCE